MPLTLFALLASVLNPLPSYSFVYDTGRSVSFFRARCYLRGRFDQHGHFVETRRVELRPGELAVLSNGVDNHLVDGSIRPEPVYDFRSGQLVPGTMHKGVFTPDPKGKPIRFADYKYTPLGRQIWNLPGYYRPVFPLSRSGELSAALAGATVVTGAPLAKTNQNLSLQWLDDEGNRARAQEEKSRR